MSRTVVVEVMGTTASFVLADPEVDPSVAALPIARLRALDAQFSPYLSDSEVSRYGRGEVPGALMSQELTHVLGVCERLRAESSGAFDAWGHRSDGRFDPSGYVKGWAAELAVADLTAAGLHNLALNLGGDVICRGEPEPGQPWRVGIRHHTRADRVVAVLGLRAGAMATSGLYERANHIRDPHSRTVPAELRSLTVIGPDLALADAYATIGFVLGRAGIDWVLGHEGYEVIAITANDRVLSSDGASALRLL